MRFWFSVAIFSWVLTGCNGSRVTTNLPSENSPSTIVNPTDTLSSVANSSGNDLGKFTSEKLFFQTRSLVTLTFNGVPLLYGERFFLVNQTTKALLGAGTVESSDGALWLETPDGDEESLVNQGLAEPFDTSSGHGLTDGKALTVTLFPTDRQLKGKLVYGRNQLSLLSIQDNRRPVTDDIRLVLRDFPFLTLGTARFEGEWMGQRAGGYQGRMGWFSHVHARAKDAVLTSGVMQILHK